VIVAIESSSTDISLAVGDGDGTPLASDAWTSDRRQGHELLPRLMGLLSSRGLALQELAAVAVGIGPGSFTGLRVGMSVAKGLAMGVGCPIVGVPSLTAWLAAEPSAAAAVGRAGARELYLLERGSAEPRIVTPGDDGLTVNGTVVAPVEVAAAFGIDAAISPAAAAVAVLAAAAARLHADPGGDDLARLEPSYLRAPRGIGQVPHVEAG
jgi:tRNA threonylcarbamoyl adenosine modification protein YeaZ